MENKEIVTNYYITNILKGLKNRNGKSFYEVTFFSDNTYITNISKEIFNNFFLGKNPNITFNEKDNYIRIQHGSLTLDSCLKKYINKNLTTIIDVTKKDNNHYKTINS